MAATRQLCWTARFGFLGVWLFVALACDSHPSAPETLTGSQSAAATASSKPGEAAANSAPADAARLHQSFAEATRPEPPEGGHRPPDQTMTGKSVGKLYTQVKASWDSVKFLSPAGKRLHYEAVLDTELGSITLTLLPDVAPNHVRNFVALARAGYYDGLVFERTVHEKADDNAELQLIEGGCPLGTGEHGQGSIGYWLKPEFSGEEHVEGTLGACHAEEADTASCKFYVTLSKAPFLDKQFTVFGKVTHGLDVARRIFALPVRNDPDFPEGDRPEKPVVIRKVTIQVAELQ